MNQVIWLIRHGETAWSRSGQHTGWSDIPLLPESAAALVKLKPHLENEPFALVLSSPLQRAKHTAELVGFKTIELDDNLREWNYGSYDGKTKSEIQKEHPGWTIWKDGVVGGETLSQVASRAKKVIERAKSAPGDVALVAHAHLLRILTTCWLEIDPVNAEHLLLSPGSISKLGTDDGYPVIREWNWLPDK